MFIFIRLINCRIRMFKAVKMKRLKFLLLSFVLGTALVQVEAYLNQRKIYLKTNVYLKPECWSREGAQVINHHQSNELNAMLYEYILAPVNVKVIRRLLILISMKTIN